MYIQQVSSVDLTEARDRAEQLMYQSKEVKKQGDGFGEVFKRAKEEIRQMEEEALTRNAIRTSSAIADLYKFSASLSAGNNICMPND